MKFFMKLALALTIFLPSVSQAQPAVCKQVVDISSRGAGQRFSTRMGKSKEHVRDCPVRSQASLEIQLLLLLKAGIHLL